MVSSPNPPAQPASPVEPGAPVEPLRADSARVRARMLAAARERLAAGDLDLPMNAIAKAAGTGVGTVYRHFPSRQALLEALATENLTRLVAAAERAAAEPDIAAGLADLLRAAVAQQRADPALGPVLAAPGPTRPETAALSRALAGALDLLLARARSAGVIRPDLTADDLRALFCGLSHALEITGDAGTDRYLDVLLTGLRVHDGRHGRRGRQDG
ncbi:TetR/AcrR family transcriptional regulator [Plantactinospora sp. WMMC1484]|uniref:TetR/AcrR family transcriptional regulator n=1 Tax=Plantactinospora sp. WMMC1484 TaxID=3404122 RepID=UPI003BF5D38A